MSEEKISADDIDEDNPNYKPPPEKTLKEIVNADQGDESLRKYKEALLGEATAEDVIVDANDPRKVIVKALALVVNGREDLVLDLSGKSSSIKSSVGVILIF
jgi:hypothetical protein